MNHRDWLKCFLSWHDWETIRVAIHLAGNVVGADFRLRCRRCGKII